MKYIKGLLATAFLTSVLLPITDSVVGALGLPRTSITVDSPIFPFGDSGFCSQNCPVIGSRATANYLSVSVYGKNISTGPRVSLSQGDTILILYLGIDNGGYGNWWESKGTLVSDATGARASLGKGNASDGNDYKVINVSCDRLFNKCSPSMTWQNVRVDPSLPVGTYSLEVEFTPFAGSGLPVTTYLFGPAVLTVNQGAVAPTATSLIQGIGGRSCPKLGRIRVDQGTRYACVSSGKKKIWRKMA